MMGVQQKRKSGGEQETCQQQHHHQPHQQLKRRRGKATAAATTNATTATSAHSSEVTNAPTPGAGSDESVWIFGLISNIEQLLYNVASNGSSGSQSSGSSTPSSTTSTMSASSSSLSTSNFSSSSSSGAAALSSAPTTCGAHHQVPRSPISRQIKFHEYKGPPATKRQAPGAGSNKSQQQQAKSQLQAQARCKAPSRGSIASNTSSRQPQQAQQQQHQQKLSPVQQQKQSIRAVAKHQPHQSPQHQARHPQSATNQLTSVAVAPPAPNSNATYSVLSPAAHLQPQQQQQQQIVYDLADTSQTAIEEPQLCAQHQVMAPQTPMATSKCMEQNAQQQLGDFELAMLQLAAAAAVDNDDDYHQDNSSRGPAEVPDQVEACQLEPSIGPFACGGVEELLFSEFIDLQDVPMNVDESDWLRKFLPPCNSLGSR